MSNLTLVEQTVEKLLDFIQENSLNIGAKLPNENDLCELLGVGRSTLREAVRSLVSRNVLEVKQGAGTFISHKKGIANDPLGFSLVHDQDKMIEDLFELRFLLEPKMAALAAKNANEAQLKKLEQLNTAIANSFRNHDDKHVKLDIEFHTTIAEASGNVGLLHVIPIINKSIALFNQKYSNERLKVETIDIHNEITNAIKNGEETQAYDTMLIHMANNRREMKTIKK